MVKNDTKIYTRHRIKLPKITEDRNKRKIIKILLILVIAITIVRAVLLSINPIIEEKCKTVAKSIATKISNEQATLVMAKYTYEDLINVIKDENGNIKLKNTSQNTINEANQILLKSKKYPTEWYPLKNYSVYSSKKFKKATKNAFASAMTSWLTTKIPSPQIIVGAAVSAYVTYYFVNSDECNVYFRYLYYYRIVGPTKFDKNGNAIPQYELKRKMTTSKNKKFTSGQNKTQTKKSSILTW